MSDLGELYQEVILDHNRRPRNFHKMEGANRRADGFNPLCGDRVTIYLDVKDDVVRDISFEGSGCAISKASASMMTESLKGKSRGEAEALFATFHHLVTGEAGAPPQGSAAPSPGAGIPATEAAATGTPAAGSPAPDLGKLVVFSGVREFPVRVKCATLAWHALRSALENRQEIASTE